MDIELALQLVLSIIPGVIDTVKDNSVRYQSHILKVKEKAKQLAEESKEKIASIPEEHLIQNPKTSVILPIIQTSLYYLDEEEIKNLFTNLFPYVTPDYDLTASVVDCMNKTINGTIIMAIYLSLAAILYYFSYRRILKMDI